MRSASADLFTLHPVAWAHAQNVLAKESDMLLRGIGAEQRAEYILNEYQRLRNQAPVVIQQVWTELFKEWDRGTAARDIDDLRLNLEGHGFRGTLREIRGLYRRHGLAANVLDVNMILAGCWLLSDDDTFVAPVQRILQPLIDVISSDDSVAAAEPIYNDILAAVELQSVKDRAMIELAVDTLTPIMQRVPELLFTSRKHVRDLVVVRGRLLDLTISDVLLSILCTAGTTPLRRMFTESLEQSVSAYQHVIRITLQDRMEQLGAITIPVETPASPEPQPLGRPEDITLLTPEEAARRLGISPTTLWRLVRDGAITKTRIRGAVRYDPRELDRYLGRSKP